MLLGLLVKRRQAAVFRIHRSRAEHLVIFFDAERAAHLLDLFAHHLELTPADYIRYEALLDLFKG